MPLNCAGNRALYPERIRLQRLACNICDICKKKIMCSEFGSNIWIFVKSTVSSRKARNNQKEHATNCTKKHTKQSNRKTQHGYFLINSVTILREVFSHQHGRKSCPFFFSAKWNFCPHLAPDECSCPTSVLFLGLGQASQSHAAA